jgi:hypothetical protein
MENIMKQFYYLIFIFLISLISCDNNSGNNFNYEVDYNDSINWVYQDSHNFETDVFFVAPTVFLGNDSTLNMDITNTNLRNSFTGAVNMEKGLYDGSDFYAPYYRQASLKSFMERGYEDESTDEQIQKSFDIAYNDVEAAFTKYLELSDKPFILAGFSQGSELIIKLLKYRIKSTELMERLIAAYAIGWRLLPADTLNYTNIRNAKGEFDTGVIITYSTEDISIDKSLIVPEFTLSINPLNWKTDSTFSDKSMNKGAAFTDYSGTITEEIPEFTGAYICPKRGTLKVTDVNPDDYPPVLGIFSKGEFHIYDYLFFYYNLKENIQNRRKAYLE